MSSIPLMTTGEPLKGILGDTPSIIGLQRVVINKIWGTNWTSLEYNDCQKAYSSYFHRIYQDLCKAACSGDAGIPNYSHEQLLQIMSLLKLGNNTKADILRVIPPVTGSTQLQKERAVNLAAGLLVPFNFSGMGGARPVEMISWQSNESLKTLVDRKAQLLSNVTGQTINICSTCTSSVKFSKKFSAWHLKHVAGFNITWTNNLLDHLLLLEDETEATLYLFHQVKVLELHQSLPETIIPEDLIVETFDTLALLFPRNTRKNRVWYDKLEKAYNLDPGAFRRPYLKLEDREIARFKYWGTRLVQLKRAFDDHEPNGPVQWWRDDRKPVQWWTFWVAVLVLVLTIAFGVIQSVASILQVIKS